MLLAAPPCHMHVYMYMYREETASLSSASLFKVHVHGCTVHTLEWFYSITRPTDACCSLSASKALGFGWALGSMTHKEGAHEHLPRTNILKYMRLAS